MLQESILASVRKPINTGSAVRTRPDSSIDGLLHVELQCHEDGRGSFVEIFRRSWFEEAFGRDVQLNCTRSCAGVLRGLHFHERQWDFWFPVSGVMRAGFHDLRPASPSRGVSTTADLSPGAGAGILIPPGVAHGYLTLEESVLLYVVSSYYDGTDEHGIAWDDPDAGIDWGVDGTPLLSERDASNPPLRRAARGGPEVPE